MKIWRFKEAWASNYLALHRPALQDYLAELYLLSILARGVFSFIDARRIHGDAYAERLCIFVLASIRRLADFRELVDDGRSAYISQIRTAQLRIEGLKLEGA
jgi:hypothetical protein